MSEIKVDAISFGSIEETDNVEKKKSQEVPDFSAILVDDRLEQNNSPQIEQEEPVSEEVISKEPAQDFSYVISEDVGSIDEEETYPDSEPDIEAQKSFIKDANETLRQIEEEEEKKENEPLKDLSLEKMKITKIVGVSGLQPMILYAEVEGEENPIGLPGFFDERNQIFMLSEVNPVPSENFQEVFRSFLEEVSERKQKKYGGESDETD